MGDFNKDGHTDVLGLRRDGTLWFYQGTTSATIGAGRQGEQRLGRLHARVLPGDLTRNGHFDLVGLRSDGAVFGYENQSGPWERPVTSSAAQADTA